MARTLSTIGPCLAATLLALSDVAAAAVLVVSQDGSGDFDTIAEAIAAAESGDTVQIHAGWYNEEDGDGEPVLAGRAHRAVVVGDGKGIVPATLTVRRSVEESFQRRSR